MTLPPFEVGRQPADTADPSPAAATTLLRRRGCRAGVTGSDQGASTPSTGSPETMSNGIRLVPRPEQGAGHSGGELRAELRVDEARAVGQRAADVARLDAELADEQTACRARCTVGSAAPAR